MFSTPVNHFTKAVRDCATTASKKDSRAVLLLMQPGKQTVGVVFLLASFMVNPQVLCEMTSAVFVQATCNAVFIAAKQSCVHRLKSVENKYLPNPFHPAAFPWFKTAVNDGITQF